MLAITPLHPTPLFTTWMKALLPKNCSRKILSFDPGETTGYAYLQCDITPILNLQTIGSPLMQGEEQVWAHVEVRSNDVKMDFHLSYGQLKTPSIEEAVPQFGEVFEQVRDKKKLEVVIEDYRVYSWKAKDHKWNKLITSQLIGALQTQCIGYQIPTPYLRMAQVPKHQCTDSNLEMWGFKIPGKYRHARDAIRHAIYQLCYT